VNPKLKFRRDITKFLLVGLAATLLDLSSYFIMTNSGVSENLAKALSFLGGTFTGYLGNTKFTFSGSSPSPLKYSLTYSFSLLVNVGVNAIAFQIWDSHLFGWIMATASSTTVNFLGLRYYAFAQKV
jgi:putative flippase GtrA